jgi:hypothetical protein
VGGDTNFEWITLSMHLEQNLKHIWMTRNITGMRLDSSVHPHIVHFTPVDSIFYNLEILNLNLIRKISW